MDLRGVQLLHGVWSCPTMLLVLPVRPQQQLRWKARDKKTVATTLFLSRTFCYLILSVFLRIYFIGFTFNLMEVNIRNMFLEISYYKVFVLSLEFNRCFSWCYINIYTILCFSFVRCTSYFVYQFYTFSIILLPL